MLQINKRSYLEKIQLKYQFLLRSSKLKHYYTIKKKKTTTIFLRSPKHFNIGKHKVFNLKHKLYFSQIKVNALMFTKTLIKKEDFFFTTIFKSLPNSHQHFLSSYKIYYKTHVKFV